MRNKKKLNIVLAGQANVGKSVIFNHLTGLHQHIGNWAGKTVEKAEGTLFYKGYSIDVLDLPGIYSLTTYSLEELISREYIAVQKPDFVINVVSATNLERNLLFTLQLLELERPIVIALNMFDLIKHKGIEIDFQKLEELLNVPIVPTIGAQRKGLTKVLDSGIKLIRNSASKHKSLLKYGKEVEERIEVLIKDLANIKTLYPKRWLAIKLLEKDKAIEMLINNTGVLSKTKKLINELEKIHGHDSSIVIAQERCFLSSQILQKVMKITKPKKITLSEKWGNVTSHKFWGYLIMVTILLLMFLSVFQFGDWFSSMLEKIGSGFHTKWDAVFGVSVLASLAWSAIEGVIALIEIALPYIIPFYLILFLLEDWGYLARVAFLTDSFMHRMGVHGKACIPLILGFGCNVPACLSCRIMETERERFLTGFLTTLVPCAAVTVIIMGLVGKFVGIGWALGLYLFAIIVIFILGKIASKILPGEPTELIMEMPEYKQPNLKTVILQTWFRLKKFICIATPVVVISGVIIEAVRLLNGLPFIANLLSPITVNWLGLPSITGILLILGILRKELILVMLATLMGTTNFIEVMTPVQMITLALVSMFYIPCVATIAALWKEFGWKKTLIISLFEITFAIVIAGIISKILTILWI
ncbi:ferrous iron transport protein B [Candidatus Peregrinibacteria bacterium]|nr:ferrous iron transport protein B [Candidatus Peregrinibacteria bacterium]